jgi:hypothetical protein
MMSKSKDSLPVREGTASFTGLKEPVLEDSQYRPCSSEGLRDTDPSRIQKTVVLRGIKMQSYGCCVEEREL